MKLAVVVIHGMGTQNDDFAAGMMAKLIISISGQGYDPTEVAWSSIFWADVLKARQEAYMDAAARENTLSLMSLREFVVEAMGDAAAYQYVDEPSSTYSQIHDIVRHKVAYLYTTTLGSEPVPMVVLAHSLGSHIMSSYIWDCQKQHATGAGEGASPFEQMEWLAGMITFGSTIPLFTFAHDEVKPIRFPGNALPPADRARARWYNYFDRHDVLGYPLKQISPGYASVVDDDIEINVGNFWESRTPMSHTRYWTDPDFIDPVARFLGTFLE